MGGCTHNAHIERGDCIRSIHEGDYCVHSTQREGTPTPVDSLVLTGVDELHQDQLLHVLMEDVLQRAAPFLPQPGPEFLPREQGMESSAGAEACCVSGLDS